MNQFSEKQMKEVIRLLWLDKHQDLGLHHLLFEIIDPESSLEINYGDALDGFESEYLPEPGDIIFNEIF
ncbi:MAG: hypothetical protein HOI55_00030 [Candidatus Marinimicrobia bacterium]|jgi:hypothetical protein|nr:hypothetical protein [Candidatus Neomarinimicrobiota bacterium]